MVNNITNVTIIPVAISDSTKFLQFKEGWNCAEGHVSNHGTLPVSAISIDDFVSTYQIVPSLIKIDIEGAEMPALKGAARLIAEHQPTLLLSTHGEANRNDCLEFCMAMKCTQLVPLNHSKIDEASEFAIVFSDQRGGALADVSPE